jgi:transposase-like protein
MLLGATRKSHHDSQTYGSGGSRWQEWLQDEILFMIERNWSENDRRKIASEQLYRLLRMEMLHFTYLLTMGRLVVKELPVMKSVLSDLHFHNEEAAFAYVEAKLWPDGPVCHHCGEANRIGKLQGKTTRAGLYKCYACRKPFTVRMGTVFESSHVPLRIWLQAIYLMCSSKKGISTRQLQRTFGGSMKTSWFLTHRIREAMTAIGIEPMGGAGAIVEIDETFIGKKEGVPVRRGYAHKHAVMTLVERGKGSRSFHVSGTAWADLLPIIKAHIASGTHVMTDEAGQYGQLGKFFTEHDYVRHGAGEYVRGIVHTNTVEGFYSVFKRGMIGIYQHCGERHLHRYVAEFDFRYNNRIKLGVDDIQRADRALVGVKGKRLTYRTTAWQVSG